MLQTTSRKLRDLGLTRPTVLIDKARATANIRRMADRAARAGAVFRPHFKTHQSGVVGRWFHEAGIRQITVSSLDMAARFANLGWRDITVAILHNPLADQQAQRLVRQLHERGGRLGLLVDDPDVAAGLAAFTSAPTDVWLKIDTGYGRTGIRWDDEAGLRSTLDQCRGLTVVRGLLTHSGHSYRARSRAEIQDIYTETIEHLETARRLTGRPDLELSLGDTPCCNVADDLSACDEIRPGNFVFADLMQLQIGSCRVQDLAAAVACPVLGVYPERQQIVLHGGAVHLSKEFLTDEKGQACYGCLGTMTGDGLGEILPQFPLVSLSQEHGIVACPEGVPPLAAGDLVLVWPVHSCLSCNLLNNQMEMPLTV